MLILFGHTCNALFSYVVLELFKVEEKERKLNPQIVLGANAVVVIMFICAIFDFFKNHFVSQILSAAILLVLFFLNIVHALDVVNYREESRFLFYEREMAFVYAVHFMLMVIWGVSITLFDSELGTCTHDWRSIAIYFLFGIAS